MDKPPFSNQFVMPFVVIGVLLLLLALEPLVPLRVQKRSWLRRAIINGILASLTFVVGTFVVTWTAHYLSKWSTAESFGLLHWIPMPFPIRFAIGFLLLDLTFYYWHRVNHVVPVLWRFHNVHHVDPDLDVTTAFRFHFVEVLYSTPFRAAQVVLLGISLYTYVIFELVFQCCTIFHHSNLRLPIGLERALNKIIVTPRMHGIHHSNIKDENNTNYSVIFRWWDWLNRSLYLSVLQSEIIIGVKGFQEKSDNSLWSLLSLPFRRKKDRGERPAKTIPARSALEEVKPGFLLE